MSSYMFGHAAVSAISQTRAGMSAASDASSAKSAASQAKRDVTHIEDRLDRLALINMAMWSLIQDKTNLTEADLLERVKIIDLMDGVEDGKVTRTVSKCAKCDRVMNARHDKCMYCGSPKLVESAFDRL